MIKNLKKNIFILGNFSKYISLKRDKFIMDYRFHRPKLLLSFLLLIIGVLAIVMTWFILYSILLKSDLISIFKTFINIRNKPSMRRYIFSTSLFLFFIFNFLYFFCQSNKKDSFYFLFEKFFISPSYYFFYFLKRIFSIGFIISLFLNLLTITLSYFTIDLKINFSFFLKTATYYLYAVDLIIILFSLILFTLIFFIFSYFIKKISEQCDGDSTNSNKKEEILVATHYPHLYLYKIVEKISIIFFILGVATLSLLFIFSILSLCFLNLKFYFNFSLVYSCDVSKIIGFIRFSIGFCLLIVTVALILKNKLSNNSISPKK